MSKKLGRSKFNKDYKIDEKFDKAFGITWLHKLWWKTEFSAKQELRKKIIKEARVCCYNCEHCVMSCKKPFEYFDCVKFKIPLMDGGKGIQVKKSSCKKYKFSPKKMKAAIAQDNYDAKLAKIGFKETKK